MDPALEEKLKKTFLYYEDDRSPIEIQLTNKLVHALSQMNIDRVQQRQPKTNNQVGKKSEWFYVCLNGIPPYQNEFINLSLPGESMQFRFTCFQNGLTEQQIKTMPSLWEDQAKALHSEIESKSKGKPLVFVFHSFGTFIATTYFKMFPIDRIIGIIDVGGAPLQFYPFLKDLIRIFETLTIQFMEQNIDLAYEHHKKQNKAVKLKAYENKYQLLSVTRCMKQGKGFKEMFSDVRDWPKVLKCIIFGRQDYLFPQTTWNEKPIHYCYRNKLNSQYQSSLIKAYTKLTGSKCSNIQQKLIFSLPDGYHSIHIQRRYQILIKQIVAEYLELLEQQQNMQATL